MEIRKIMEYALSRPGATLDYPFGPDTPCVRVAGKIFALFLENSAGTRMVNLKCVPELLPRFLSEIPGVLPGYHMNKTHWLSVLLDGDTPLSDALPLVDMSYGEVVKGLPKRIRVSLAEPADAADRRR